MGVVYLYPLYASFKALTTTSRRGSTPGAYRWHNSSSRHYLSEEEAAETEAAATELSELENWTMYWCVISVFWIFDRWLEWAFRWCVKKLLRIFTHTPPQGIPVCAFKATIFVLACITTNSRMYFNSKDVLTTRARPFSTKITWRRF